MHKCPVSGCDTRVADDLLMCRRHWALVPIHLRSPIYRAFDRGAGVGAETLLRAQRAAIDAVNATQNLNTGRS